MVTAITLNTAFKAPLQKRLGCAHHAEISQKRQIQMRSLPQLIDDALNGGWTITGLAGASGISQSNISKLRKGSVSQDSRLGRKLRNFLDLHLENVWPAVSNALGRVLSRHPGREREIMNFVLGLDLLLSGPPIPEGDRRRRGRKVTPLPTPAESCTDA